MLTIPTPEIAASSPFAPEPSSPFTTQKFIAAKVYSLDNFSPSLPICAHPNLPPGAKCRPCEKQLLACRRWYEEQQFLGHNRRPGRAVPNEESRASDTAKKWGHLEVPIMNTRGLGIDTGVSESDDMQEFRSNGRLLATSAMDPRHRIVNPGVRTNEGTKLPVPLSETVSAKTSLWTTLRKFFKRKPSSLRQSPGWMFD